jgi:hypothetical protein
MIVTIKPFTFAFVFNLNPYPHIFAELQLTIKKFMKKILAFIFLFSFCTSFAQTIDERLLFVLTNYEGNVDTYSLTYDKNTGRYAYVYYISQENKSFIISNNTVSEKYDGVSSTDIKFDSEGNYYTVTTNYKEDYGIDNNFIISNGKVIKAYDLIEGYSAFINNRNEYVFIFQENNQYKIGYYNPSSGFRQSEGYDLVKPIYKSYDGRETLYEDMFFKNSLGERGFIGIKNNKAFLIFNDKITPTNYSDIMEYSFTTDRNGYMAFIAKSNGRFYDVKGNEFVVVGTREYPKFDYVNAPLMFNSANEPVYTVTDSVSSELYVTRFLIGENVQTVYLDNSKTQKAPEFSSGIYEIKIDDAGNITYMAGNLLDIGTGDEYSYNTQNYFVKNGIAEELGINVGLMRFGKNGEMLFGAKENKFDELYQLYLLDGSGKRKINTISYDAFSDYGFTPDGKIYYIAENFNLDSEKNYLSSKYFLYLDGKIIAEPPSISYQGFNYSETEPASAIQFDSRGNYSFSTDRIIDTVNFRYVANVWTNGNMLSYNSKISSPDRAYNYISNLSYLDNDKLFYIGNIIQSEYLINSEILIDNQPVGNVYDSINDLKYDPVTRTVTFRGSRGKEIFDVTLRLN